MYVFYFGEIRNPNDDPFPEITERNFKNHVNLFNIIKGKCVQIFIKEKTKL